MTNPIFVTAALPYANGPIHLGHLVEHIQADIWVRFQKLNDKTCFFVCADDAHGTPVMMKAKKTGQDVEKMIASIHDQHQQSFSNFLIEHDIYHSTHSEENKRWVYRSYQLLKEADLIVSQSIEQFYDEKSAMFLPDRFILGTCPRCGAEKQYGDGCEACGSIYNPNQLIDPISVVSQTTPKKKTSQHNFFALSKTQDYLSDYLNRTPLQSPVLHKLQEWFEDGLKNWDITRDAPYFGFEIPDCPHQYFYVWLDAPLGYFAALERLCAEKNLGNVDDYILGKKPCFLYHFIGKDIIYFHSLFWPAILNACDFKTPDNLFVHGFLNIQGKKMSKSKGVFIEADEYIKHLPPESLRYFLATRLGTGLEDLNLDVNDLRQQFNADLVGKIVNIASRTSKFLDLYFDNKVQGVDAAIFDVFDKTRVDIENAYQMREFSKAMRLIMGLAGAVNQYIDEHKPWAVVKQDGPNESVWLTCSTGIQAFRWLMIFLKPVLPVLAQQSEEFLHVKPFVWSDLKAPLPSNHAIGSFKPLLHRIEESDTAFFSNL